MVIKFIVLAICLLQINAYFCYSQCGTSVNTSCNGGPYLCLGFSSPFVGYNSLLSGYSPVEMVTVPSITAANNYKMSQNFVPFTCVVAYTTPAVVTYTYDLLGKFVSTDYIYKRYTVTKPHYRIMIKLSITFVGVWSSNDYLNLYTFDGTTANNFPMRYSCTDSSINYT